MKKLYLFLNDFQIIFFIISYMFIGFGLWKLIKDVLTFSISFRDMNDIVRYLFLGYIFIKLTHKIKSENINGISDNNNDVKAYVAADILTDDEEKADDVKAYVAADILTDDVKDY